MILFLPNTLYSHINFLPTFYYDFYLLLLFFSYLLIIVAILIFFIVNVFNNRFWQTAQEQSVYECGFLPFEEARVRFEPKFYMIALSFIIFDLEICFIIPWLLIFSYLNLFYFFYFYIFIILVLFGIIYEWKNGIFDWNL